MESNGIQWYPEERQGELAEVEFPGKKNVEFKLPEILQEELIDVEFQETLEEKRLEVKLPGKTEHREGQTFGPHQ